MVGVPMTGHLDRIAWHTCQHCGKRGFSTRKRAKKMLQRMRSEKSGMSAYQCHYDPTVWHLGHTPTAVRRGYATRDDISTPRKRDTV